jgi:hypothetical protein
VCSRRALRLGPGHAAPPGQSAQSARQPFYTHSRTEKGGEGRKRNTALKYLVMSREMENISRGSTFGDFVTVLTERSMQDVKVERSRVIFTAYAIQEKL